MAGEFFLKNSKIHPHFYLIKVKNKLGGIFVFEFHLRGMSIYTFYAVIAAIPAGLALVTLVLCIVVLKRKKLRGTVRKKVFLPLLLVLFGIFTGFAVRFGIPAVQRENMSVEDLQKGLRMMTELDPDLGMVGKPVIYLYPEEEMEVTVRVDLEGELGSTYPAYGNGWNVTARPDGTLTLSGSDREYYALFWEGRTAVDWDFSSGFVVPGEQTAAFLEDALAKLGLTDREANEFILYWLPQMEGNPFNLISFQTDRYERAAQLTVDPAPDTLIRVFMAWQPLDAPIEVPPQSLSAPVREGFTVVEWGGGQARDLR